MIHEDTCISQNILALFWSCDDTGYPIVFGYKISKMLLFFLGKQYKDIVHSLDVWHKTKSIKKCLGKVCTS